MAVKRGCFGLVYADDLATATPTQVREVSAWAFTETAERLDASEIGTCTKKFQAGSVETTGTLTMYWDPAAGSNQGDLTVGNEIDLELYPEGNASGDVYYETGADGATVTEVAREGSVDGLVTMTVTFAVNGSFTTSTVP